MNLHVIACGGQNLRVIACGGQNSCIIWPELQRVNLIACTQVADEDMDNTKE